MKKMQVFAAIMVVVVVFVSCVKNSAYVKEYEIVKNDNEILKQTIEQLEKKIADLEKELQEYQTQTNDNSGKGTENKPEKKTMLCYSDENVSIYFSHCEKSPSYSYTGEWKAVFEIKNKASAMLTIGINTLAINGIDFSDAFTFEEISSGSTGKVKVSTSEYDGSDINQVSASFYIADRSEKLGWDYLMYDATFSIP